MLAQNNCAPRRGQLEDAVKPTQEMRNKAKLLVLWQAIEQAQKGYRARKFHRTPALDWRILNWLAGVAFLAGALRRPEAPKGLRVCARLLACDDALPRAYDWPATGSCLRAGEAHPGWGEYAAAPGVVATRCAQPKGSENTGAFVRLGGPTVLSECRRHGLIWRADPNDPDLEIARYYRRLQAKTEWLL